jgi:outer membrane cobalamin receptor
MNAAFFTNANAGTSGLNNALGRLFTVEYMNSTCAHVELNGEYSVENRLTLLGRVRYNAYVNTSDNAVLDAQLAANGRRAWYRPGVEARLRADVRAVDKLTVFADYKLEALRYAQTPTAFAIMLDPINDLSFGANYKMSKEVGIFLHVNNLLDQRYPIYYGYPVHGFTAVVGGSVSF